MSNIETQALVAVASTLKLAEPSMPRYVQGTSHQAVLVPREHQDNPPGINRRSAHILDAIACILVSAPQHEIYAVGAQVDFETYGKFTLTVGSNQNVSKETVTYLEKVWDVLLRLSRHYKRYQKKPKQGYTDETPPKHPLEEGSIPGPYVELVHLVYSNCLPKWRRRLHKRYSTLITCRDSLEDRVRGKEIDKDDKFFGWLYYVIALIEKFHNASEAELRTMLAAPNLFAIEITELYLFTQQLGGDEERLRVFLGKDFDILWRYIRKVSAFGTAISDLDRLAYSRRTSPILKKTLVINCLPAQEGAALPISDEWDKLVKHIFDGYERNVQLQQGINNAKNSHCGKKGLVHCELKVLSYFVSEKFEGSPLSYIGVSKLACMGCWTVFEAWNNHHERPKYHLQGSHGKWYYPWAVPNLTSKNNTIVEEDDSMSYFIWEGVRTKIFEGLRREELFCVKSDSSVPSDASHKWELYEKEEISAIISERLGL